MAFLTDRTLATGVTSNDLIHIVVTGDTSQNPAGSSFKATMGQVLDLINPTTITGGTYDPIIGTITFYDDTGGSFNVTGLVTGYTNTAVTAFTYNNTNTFTVFENDVIIIIFFDKKEEEIRSHLFGQSQLVLTNI